MSVATESGTPVSEQTSNVVEARDLARRYGEGSTAVDALRGVSLDVRAGELVAVMGPSGSGKSTLMHVLAGLDKPTSGTVTIAGTEITTLGDQSLTRLRRKHIGFVFQFFNLLPMLDAAENIVLPLSIAGEKPDKAWLHEPLEQPELVTRVALKGLLGRKLRAVLTASAIVLGVAMISGTYVLTDTIKSAFGTVFTQVYKNADAVITGKSAIGGNSNDNSFVPPSLPDSLLSRVRSLPGVLEAQGGIADQARLVGRNGKVIEHGGAPGLAFS